MYTAIQSAIAVDFTLYKIKLLLLLFERDACLFHVNSSFVCICCLPPRFPLHTSLEKDVCQANGSCFVNPYNWYPAGVELCICCCQGEITH